MRWIVLFFVFVFFFFLAMAESVASVVCPLTRRLFVVTHA
jgi:hypothetical protein